MRKKMKEIMNKEEGFTLVELLAVIVILGIILAIAIPSIGKVIDKARTDTEGTEEVLIKDAARLYFTAEEDANGKAHGTVTIKILVDEGYLDLRESKISNTNEEVIKNENGKVVLPNGGFSKEAAAGG